MGEGGGPGGGGHNVWQLSGTVFDCFRHVVLHVLACFIKAK